MLNSQQIFPKSRLFTSHYLLFPAVFMHCLLVLGQSYQRQMPAAEQPILANVFSEASGIAFQGRDSGEKEAFNFKKAAKELGVANRRVTEIKSLFNGYYLVAGVFGEAKNADRFLYALEKKGFKPKNIVHPKSNLHYILLDYHEDAEAALSAVASNLLGTYTQPLWIMEVADCQTAPSNLPLKDISGNADISKSTDNSKAFLLAAKSGNIPARSISSLAGVAAGYYLVAGVFGEADNAKKFTSRLNGKKLNASYFYNPRKNSFYVQLGWYTDWQKAMDYAASKGNGNYAGDLWILHVQGDGSDLPATRGSKMEGSASGVPQKKAQKNSGLILENIFTKRKGTKDPPSLAKLVEKADSYFEKMWYAEAAELYEQVVDQIETPTFELIRKAGDAHYFNTNMARAYYWYDQLFDAYKDDMSSENLFKYAHSLKGTGRYGRAKRLMRLYNRKLKDEHSNIPDKKRDDAAREVIMDNILGTATPVEIKNLLINSKYSDFGPMYYNDNEVVFASAVDSSFFSTRRYKWNNQPYLDLYVAKINEETDEVKGAVKFSKKVNTKYHEAGVTFSADNATMYFTRNNYGKKLRRDKNGINHLKIYQSKKIDGEWTEAVELPFNSDSYSTGHPALSPDGKQLYFVSDMPGSIGETDIFVVDVLEGGGFSEPRNLGPEINTERKEMFPFINDKKLYFSSDGHVGLGGLDVFEVAFDGTEGFLEVRNLGKPINSNMDDFSYIVNEESQKGFFASNRRGGKGDDDIYSFKRPIIEEINTNAIAGVITELVTGDVLPEALVELLDENNRKLKEIVTGEDGSFVFEDLDSTTKYIVRTQRAGFEKEEQEIMTKDNEIVQVAINLRRLEERIVVEDGIKKFKTEMIYFDFDKSYIRPDAAAELDKLVSVMNTYPDMVIKIESHTDSRGAATYNKYLSDRRAKSSREYLISQGIAPNRIESATGYGEERLLNECNGRVRCSEEQHQLNRRSEFIIVSM